MPRIHPTPPPGSVINLEMHTAPSGQRIKAVTRSAVVAWLSDSGGETETVSIFNASNTPDEAIAYGSAILASILRRFTTDTVAGTLHSRAARAQEMVATAFDILAEGE